ncbi:MAG: hypothetical protein QOG06_324 [Gaiellaceae bacterium]|jgi:hypothetical protein|nr:hypothetical protein [Gaiellaceae bacterium]
MPSPFISVSRRGSRIRQPSRLKKFSAVIVIGIVVLLAVVVPAVAAPHSLSSVSPIAIAKRALRVATGANKTAKKALRIAKRPLADNSVTSAKIADSNVTNADLAPGAVGSGKIANGAIHTADIGDGQVTGIKITNGSVTTADLNGADIIGTIQGVAGAVAANSCVTSAITLGGAQVGDAAFITFTGSVPAPPGLTFEIIKISSPGQGTIRFCNPTNSASVAFSNVGIRVITLH